REFGERQGRGADSEAADLQGGRALSYPHVPGLCHSRNEGVRGVESPRRLSPRGPLCRRLCALMALSARLPGAGGDEVVTRTAARGVYGVGLVPGGGRPGRT